MRDRASYKTFQPGDRVTVCRVIRHPKQDPYHLEPGMVGVVERMGQCVHVRFADFPYPAVWWLYDGDLVKIGGRTGGQGLRHVPL